jgi:plasmid maintenance system antidote protein VapI
MTVKEIINKYIKRHGITKAQLAAKAELAPQVISDLCAERRKAGKMIARKLMKATNNEINFKDLRPDLSDILTTACGD